MRTFEDYEKIAIESKKRLFEAYVKQQNLEFEYQKKGGIQTSIEVYKWRDSEKEKLDNEFEKNTYRSLFLDAWNKGNFYSCDYYINRF